jgi:hypothetical protein
MDSTISLSDIQRARQDLTARKSFLSRGGTFIIPEETRKVINLKLLLDLYLSDPISQRAVDMKATDLITKGYSVNRTDMPEEVDWSQTADELDAFLKDPDLDIVTQFYRMSKDGMVFGNAYREIIYVDDDKTDAEDEPDGKGIERLVPIHPSQVIIIEDDREDEPTYGEIIYYMVMPPGYHLRQSVQKLVVPFTRMGMIAGDGKLVHPDRVLHQRFSMIGDANVGISLLEPAYNILRSKIVADKVIGTILGRQAKAIPIAQIENATPNQIRKMMKILSAANSNPETNSPIVFDETVTKMEFAGASGKVIDPTNFYKILYDNIAVNFGIPRTILLGAETGSISGADLNLAIYLKNLKADQERVIEPLLKKMLTLHWKSKYGEELPKSVSIDFTQVFAEEIAFVKSRFMDVQSSTAGWHAGLMKFNEARIGMGLEPVEDGDRFIEVPTDSKADVKDPTKDLPSEVTKDIKGE